MAYKFSQRLLEQADFAYAKLDHVRFKNCAINNIQFSGISARNVDLVSSRFQTINSVTSMRGVKIDREQLVALSYTLAAGLGIELAGYFMYMINSV